MIKGSTIALFKGGGGDRRQHLGVRPHSWIVVGPKNADEADDSCGRRWGIQVKVPCLVGPFPDQEEPPP